MTPGSDVRAELAAQAWQGELSDLQARASGALAEVQQQVAELRQQVDRGALVSGDVILARRAARQLVIAAAELQEHLAGLSTAHKLAFARPPGDAPQAPQ